MNRHPLVVTLLLLQIWSGSLYSDDILSGLGGFEQPVVTARTPLEKGGDPSGPHALFASFSHMPGGKGGTLSAGLTNETAHSGTQSLYIEADKFSTPFMGAGIQTHPIPVLPGATYRMSLWCKMDSKTPFALQTRPLYLKMQTDFIAADKETQVGETVYLLQPIPGTKNREPFFKDNTWIEFGTEFSTPADAAYAITTWRWETGSEPGESTGVIYFDDFAIQGDLPTPSLAQIIQAAKDAEPASDQAPAQAEGTEATEGSSAENSAEVSEVKSAEKSGEVEKAANKSADKSAAKPKAKQKSEKK